MADLEKRVQSKVIEPSNYALLRKLIEKAETADEAIKIAELGTTYKRTGFHFDKRLEKTSDTISYFKKNTSLSFTQNPTDITHKLIIGDNYPALLNLLIQYRGRVDVIYIDPPYGKDSMGEYAQTNYENNITRDNLLSMLYPRLVLAKQLLSDSGVIFCSIDDRNQAYIKGLFDEVFEERNFISNFFRKTKTMTGDESAGVNIQHDYVLCFSKEKKYVFLFGKEKDYTNYANPDNDPKGCWTSGDPSAKSGGPSTYFEIVNPYTNRKDLPPKGRFWAFSQDTLQKYIKTGRICFKQKYKDNERGFIFKRYKNELSNNYNALNSIDFCEKLLKNTVLNSVGTQELLDVLESYVFDNPKPVHLIKELINAVHNKEAVVLDFFAGSGTTGQAVLELNKKDGGNRQYICVQLNENLDQTLLNDPKNQTIKNQIALCDKYHRPHELSEITAERLRRVMTGKCYDGSTDFEWNKKNTALGGNLDVYNIETVPNFETAPNKTAFDVIDETLYGQEKFTTVQEKVEWVCANFEHTQKQLEAK